MSKKNRKKAPSSEATEAAAFGAGLTGQAREAWLAGLGALRAAGKKGAAEFEALAARGARLRDGVEDAAEWTLTRVDEALEPAADAAEEALEAIQDEAGERLAAVGALVDRGVEAAVRRLHLARRSDVEKLRARLHALEDRLARLSGAERPEPAVFRVRAHADGWAITRDGTEEPLGIYPKKKPALTAARAAARRSAPSRFVAHGRDGEEQEVQVYHA